MSTADTIIKIYRDRVAKNKALRRLTKNPRTFEAAEKYAAGLGEELAGAVGDITGMSQEDLTAILDAGLRVTHGDVTAFCRQVQRYIYDQAGLGIGVLSPEYDRRAAVDLVDALAIGGEDGASLLNRLTKEALKVVDETIQKNTEAADSMGLSVRIVRRYDHVGLRQGTRHAEDCQWCLAREGSWTSVKEAKEAGAFERHPGCGCVIEYEVIKTRTWSNSKGAWQKME